MAKTIKNNDNFERYTRAILGLSEDKRFFSLAHRADGELVKKSFFPDFIPPSADSQFQVGLEVTRAYTEEQGLENAWIDKNFGKQKTAYEINEDRKTFGSRLKAEAKTINGITYIDDRGMFNYEDRVSQVKESIKRKLNLLNSSDGHAETFSSNRLFIYQPFGLLRYSLDELHKYQESFKTPKKFDVIYLFYMDELSVLSFENNPVIRIVKLSTETIDMAKNGL